MPDVPRYPADRRDHDNPAPRRAMLGLWIAGGAVLILFIVLHLTGVLGPGAH